MADPWLRKEERCGGAGIVAWNNRESMHCLWPVDQSNAPPDLHINYFKRTQVDPSARLHLSML